MTPWTAAHQTPLSVGYFSQEYWSGLRFPSPGDLPDPGIEPGSPASPALAGRFLPLCHLGSPCVCMYICVCVCVCVCETESESCPVVSDSLQLHRLQSLEFSRPEYWMGSLSLLQGIFPTQGSYSGLPHYSQILCQLSHKRSPRILEWVAHPFSSGSS